MLAKKIAIFRLLMIQVSYNINNNNYYYHDKVFSAVSASRIPSLYSCFSAAVCQNKAGAANNVQL